MIEADKRQQLENGASRVLEYFLDMPEADGASAWNHGLRDIAEAIAGDTLALTGEPMPDNLRDAAERLRRIWSSKV